MHKEDIASDKLKALLRSNSVVEVDARNFRMVDALCRKLGRGERVSPCDTRPLAAGSFIASVMLPSSANPPEPFGGLAELEKCNSEGFRSSTIYAVKNMVLTQRHLEIILFKAYANLRSEAARTWKKRSAIR